MSFFDYPVGARGESSDGTTILEGLSDAHWRVLLDHVQRIPFVRGEEIVRAGTREAAVYILADGEVEVVAPGRLRGGRVLATIGAGSVFGELSFFDDQPRSATVRATAAGHVLKLTRQRLEALAAWEPALARRILFDPGRTIAFRMRHTMNILSE